MQLDVWAMSCAVWAANRFGWPALKSVLLGNRLRNLCLLAIKTPIKAVHLHIAASCDQDAAVQFPNVLPTQMSAVEDQPLLYFAHCVSLGFKLAGQDYKPV